jgi:transposase-like protein
MTHRHPKSPHVDRSAFAGYRFPPEAIMLAVLWYLRYRLSYRDVEELLVERGIEVNHVTIHRWVQRFIPLLIDVFISQRRDIAGAGTFFSRALLDHGEPDEVITVWPRH